jgi:hypothetical protein
MSEREAGKAERERAGERREEEEAPREGLVDRQDSPDKRHGDALRDGSGSRHGVSGRDEEPDASA